MRAVRVAEQVVTGVAQLQASQLEQPVVSEWMLSKSRVRNCRSVRCDLEPEHARSARRPKSLAYIAVRAANTWVMAEWYIAAFDSRSC